MVEVLSSVFFDEWIAGLRDRAARIRILARINRLEAGNPGDVRSVGGGVSELRVDQGPGYRVYFTRRESVYVILLCGGDKSTQQSDIERARRIAMEWK